MDLRPINDALCFVITDPCPVNDTLCLVNAPQCPPNHTQCPRKHTQSIKSIALKHKKAVTKSRNFS